MSVAYTNNKGHNVPRTIERWIRWILPINGRFKLNFDGSRTNNISTSSWVIRDSNECIKVAGSRQLGNASIITAKCIALRDGVLTAAYNGFSNLELKGIPK